MAAAGDELWRVHPLPSLSGIHYIGDLLDHKPFRCMLDQLTDGQLQWEPLENPYDQVVLGPPENRRRYPIYSGRKRFPEELKKCFPGEEKAIDEYLKLAKVGRTLFISYAAFRKQMFLLLLHCEVRVSSC